MKLTSIVFGFGLIFCVVSAKAQTNSMAKLFPKSSEIPGWSISEPIKYFDDDRLFDYMDGAAEIPKSYSFKSLGSAKYQKSKDVKLEVAIFEMQSDEDAFGYYSIRVFLEHSPSSKDRLIPLDHPGHLYSNVGALTFWKGNYAIILQPEIGRPDDETLIAFAKKIASKIQDKGKLPASLTRLPTQDKVPGTERLVRGKAGFDAAITFMPKDTFQLNTRPAITAADYKLPGKAVTTFIATYRSEKEARTAFSAFRSILSPNATRADTVYGEFGRQKGCAAAISGSRLAVVIGLSDRSQASKFLPHLVSAVK